MAGSTQETGALVERLRARREEIEQTLLTRVHAVSDPREVGDPEYALGLREAVCAALEYAFASLGSTEAFCLPVPDQLLAQARQAARHGVSLDTVLRRYFAGYALLGDFIVQEVRSLGESGQALGQGALRIEAGALDALLDAVGTAYKAEVELRARSREQRQAEAVRRLLAGELTELPASPYPLSGWHVGAIVAGEDARATLRALAADLGLQLLIVAEDGATSWAWLGAASRPSCAAIARRAGSVVPAAMRLCLGEPARGLAGWRLSHHQAAATLTVARRRPPGVTRYVEVSLLTSMLRDDILLTSLHDLYIAPLAARRRGDATLRATLRAYFAADRNVASAAAMLGVARQTVASRLRTVEEQLGRPLADCSVELEMALELQELSR